ncbi:uncharacterized protein LOC127094037 [Lathyrus oleraceus]|uniref:uncharacterized protein LOC127094037 n=1 Tax=Pisum sativum TaxID=3888 RepID=UPI0021D1DBFF|nr:uncharacterized protein LOC127094037 [Pisum sativum]
MLKEYSSLLRIHIKEEVPFKSGAYGLPLKFLADIADYYADNGSWVIFNRLLVVMVYGAVLFPDVENLIGLAAICIFIGRNQVPTIIVDTYYVIHSKHGKRGAVVCCLLLLYKWLLIHLHVTGPFVETRGTLKWSKRVMALTSFDIKWANVMHVTEMITSCGEFSNVPLMGTKGCINYNPVLAIRQLGFPLRDEPKAREIEASVYFAKKEKPELLERLKTSWRKSIRRLQAENYQTQAKKDEMGMQLYQVDQDKRQLMHKLKEARRSVPTKRQRPENSRAAEHIN